MLEKYIKETKRNIKIEYLKEVKNGNTEDYFGNIKLIHIDSNWLKFYTNSVYSVAYNTYNIANVIAEDVLGGIYVLENKPVESVYYYAPDTLEWEDLEITYDEFLEWLFTGDTEKFYDGFRWTNWEKELKDIKNNEGILLYPYVWSNEFNIYTCSRNVVPLCEIHEINKGVIK